MKIPQKLIDKLKPISNSKEGNLLIYSDGPSNQDIQTSFLEKHLIKIEPQYVLEVGTNLRIFYMI